MHKEFFKLSLDVEQIAKKMIPRFNRFCKVMFFFKMIFQNGSDDISFHSSQVQV